MAFSNIAEITRVRIGRRKLIGRGYESLMAEHLEWLGGARIRHREANLRAYLEHPAHVDLGQRFFQSAEAALVYDFVIVEPDRREGLARAETVALIPALGFPAERALESSHDAGLAADVVEVFEQARPPRRSWTPAARRAAWRRPAHPSGGRATPGSPWPSTPRRCPGSSPGDRQRRRPAAARRRSCRASAARRTRWGIESRALRASAATAAASSRRRLTAWS